MKIKLIMIFILTLAFSGIMIYGIRTQLELEQVQEPFVELLHFMYVTPLIVAIGVTSVTNKIIRSREND